MELDQIKKICNDNKGCKDCPLYYEHDRYDCLVEPLPLKWDIERIESRLEKYGNGKDLEDM